MKVDRLIDLELACVTNKDRDGLSHFELKHDLVCGANNQYTNFPLRVAHLLWVLKGANDLASLKFYTDMYDDMTDDGTSLRGAYGPRLRNWIGPDDLQEAINKNKSLDEENYEDLSEFAKPQGTDQINAVYEDLCHDMTASTMQIFDPALDFAKTNDVPDLHSVVLFVGADAALNMSMDYIGAQINTYAVNDMWTFMFIQKIMAAFVGRECGKVYVNTIGVNFNDMTILCEPVMLENLYKYDETVDKVSAMEWYTDGGIVKFWEDCVKLAAFERHVRMQITSEAFANAQVSVSMMSETLVEALLSKIDTKVLKDMGKALLASIIIKNADNHGVYKEFVETLCEDVHADWKLELKNYCRYCNVNEIEFVPVK